MVYVIDVLLTACEQEQGGTQFRPDLLTSYKQTCMIYTIAVCRVHNS